MGEGLKGFGGGGQPPEGGCPISHSPHHPPGPEEGEICPPAPPQPALMRTRRRPYLGYIFWMAAHAFPITKSVALVLAIQICKASGRPNPFVNMEKGLSKMWWSRFRARHPTVASRRANPLERERLHGATVERVDELFHICQALYDQHGFSGTPELIYNCDETGFGDKGHSRQRILCHKGQRCVYAQQVTTREHITVHCCANAAGESIPPFVIFRGSFPSTAYGLEGPQNALYGVSEKGYMDSDLFLKWLGHFVKYARQERPLLLFMDQHEAHVGTGVVDFCRANRIEVVCLPAHTTHVLQPLDVAVYGSLKAAFSRLAHNMGLVRGDLVIGKRQFSAVLKYALEEACTPHNIISGFRRTGLFPLNRMEVDESKLVKGLRDRSAGGECFDAPEDTDEDMSTPPCTVEGPAAPAASTSTTDNNCAANAASNTTTDAVPATNTIPLSTTVANTCEVATTTTTPVSSPRGPAATTTTAVPTPWGPVASSSSTTTTAGAAAATTAAMATSTTAAAASTSTSITATAASTSTSTTAAAASTSTSITATAASTSTSITATAASTSTSITATAASTTTTAGAAAATTAAMATSTTAAAGTTTATGQCPTCHRFPNPLVRSGVIPAALADILLPPHIETPARGRGRRMPQPANVITSDANMRERAEREAEASRIEQQRQDRAAQRVVRQQQAAATQAAKAAARAVREAARRQREMAQFQARQEREARQAAAREARLAQESARAGPADCAMCGRMAPAGGSGQVLWLGCDSCTLWYHAQCVDVILVPEGEWYCPTCHNMAAREVAMQLEL
ncbi:hypothetical protein AALO_G00046870 [Alosa alosa]|uniref:PHD-type domain-containing protein n=1 Tax=Alosa alosa TaxID=278164 RepID=A0AAV6H4S9_9TELE|nr:uncharacterized protein LOC125292942 [Alosa alosa]KAG5281619.1 hypothetical protein AALO_G00046870 [Alosa alosa]